MALEKKVNGQDNLAATFDCDDIAHTVTQKQSVLNRKSLPWLF